jgi:hypothetical protein
VAHVSAFGRGGSGLRALSRAIGLVEVSATWARSTSRLDVKGIAYDGTVTVRPA